ncbi:unnamed protein product [Blepharisma stoltei]|uniref:Uncharacterized protein n=1 Tax=Blepharisma stoltei TaxID=1481888 RepID=A0AAU9K4W3_9CILI|nr:unnamed protein product [Blepharisma stoltei]
MTLLHWTWSYTWYFWSLCYKKPLRKQFCYASHSHFPRYNLLSHPQNRNAQLHKGTQCHFLQLLFYL